MRIARLFPRPTRIKKRQPTQSRISWRISFHFLFTNLASETPFYNIGLLVMGAFIEIGSNPTRFLKYFIKTKLFIAINF